MLNYTINKQLKNLEIVAVNTVTVDQIIEHYLSISRDTSLPRNLHTLIDCTNGKLQINLKNNENEKARIALNKAMNAFDSIREAVIVDKPHETFVATLFREFNHDIKNHGFEIFCTPEAALKWLRLN